MYIIINDKMEISVLNSALQSNKNVVAIDNPVYYVIFFAKFSVHRNAPMFI